MREKVEGDGVRVRKAMECSRLRIAMVFVLAMSSDQSLNKVPTADAQGNSAHAVQTNAKDPDSSPFFAHSFSWLMEDSLCKHHPTDDSTRHE